jgi:arsenical pump membrane protein
MWLICLIFAISLVICVTVINIIEKNNFNNLVNTFKRLPYDLIPFVLSMFIIVLTLNKQGITQYLTDFLGEKDITIRYGISSFLACNLINNIPMSVLFATVPHMSSTAHNLEAVFSTIIGSNLGAFLTPVGALAGIMFTSLVQKQNVNYSFKTFIKYGLIISVPTLLVALLGLMIVL